MTTESLQFGYDQELADAVAWLEANRTGIRYWQQTCITRRPPDPVAQVFDQLLELLVPVVLLALLLGLLLGLFVLQLADQYLYGERPLKSARLSALPLLCPSLLMHDDHG
jgi:hypothetical protein